MVEEYLSDREQEEALRAWWRENWRWILGGIALGFALIFAWWYWKERQERVASEAAARFAQVQSALSANDNAKAVALLPALSADYGSSAYVQQAQLLMAKNYVDAGNFDAAIPLLKSVSDKSADTELAQIAQLRLARIYVQQNKFDDALQLLKPDDENGLAAQAREIRGDALLAKGDAEGARAEYASALKGKDGSIDRPMLELKLQEVGGNAVPAAEAAAQTKPTQGQ
jgi:predicted negative regulator of RcsB-dependent stress response